MYSVDIVVKCLWKYETLSGRGRGISAGRSETGGSCTNETHSEGRCGEFGFSLFWGVLIRLIAAMDEVSGCSQMKDCVDNSIIAVSFRYRYCREYETAHSTRYGVQHQQTIDDPISTNRLDGNALNIFQQITLQASTVQHAALRVQQEYKV